MTNLKTFKLNHIFYFVGLCFIDILLKFGGLLILGFCMFKIRKENLMSFIVFDKFKYNYMVYFLTITNVFILYLIYVYAFDNMFGKNYMSILNPEKPNSFMLTYVFVSSIFFSLIFYGYYFNNAIKSNISIEKAVWLVSISYFLIHLELGDYFMILFTTLFIAYIYAKTHDLTFVILINSFVAYLINFVDYKIFFVDDVNHIRIKILFLLTVIFIMLFLLIKKKLPQLTED